MALTVFQRTETIVCSLNIQDGGVDADPDTSIKITLTDPDGTVVVNGIAMDKDNTGDYHHDYTPEVSAELGVYEVKYVAIDGDRTSIIRDYFNLDS